MGLILLMWWSLSAASQPKGKQVVHEDAVTEPRPLSSPAEVWEEAALPGTVDSAPAGEAPDLVMGRAAQAQDRLQTKASREDLISTPGTAVAQPAAVDTPSPTEQKVTTEESEAAIEQPADPHTSEEQLIAEDYPVPLTSAMPSRQNTSLPGTVAIAKSMQDWQVTPLQALLAAFLAVGLPLAAMARKRRPAKLQVRLVMACSYQPFEPYAEMHTTLHAGARAEAAYRTCTQS